MEKWQLKLNESLFIHNQKKNIDNGKKNSAVLNFMVKPCINNIQHFIFQLTHTTLKKRRIIKTF